MLVWEEDMVRALRKERESLREENARLTQRVEELERENIQFRAERDHLVAVAADAEDEVTRLKQDNFLINKHRDELEAKLVNSEEGHRWLEAQLREAEAKLAEARVEIDMVKQRLIAAQKDREEAIAEARAMRHERDVEIHSRIDAEEIAAAYVGAVAKWQAAEAKLAKVVEKARFLQRGNEPHDCPDNWCEACELQEIIDLAAAKGE